MKTKFRADKIHLSFSTVHVARTDRKSPPLPRVEMVQSAPATEARWDRKTEGQQRLFILAGRHASSPLGNACRPL